MSQKKDIDKSVSALGSAMDKLGAERVSEIVKEVKALDIQSPTIGEYMEQLNEYNLEKHKTMKQYTTEEIIQLYAQYMPDFISYKGERQELLGVGKYEISILATTTKYLSPSEILSDCRLILRPVSSLTEQELQELAVVMGEESVKIVEIGGEMYFEMENYFLGELGTYSMPLNEKLPLNIAQFLFAKQINFLNLPADIAVVE